MIQEVSRIPWALETLRFTPAWVELGALTEEIAELQYRLFHAPDADRSIEHYRFGAFRSYSAGVSEISDTDLKKWIEIGLDDDDPAMGRAIIYDLASSKFLTEKQFELVACVFDTVSFQNHVERQRIFKTLEREPSSEAFWTAARSKIANVQDHLLRCYVEELTCDVLEHLERRGKNKAVRNMARAELRKRRKSESRK